MTLTPDHIYELAYVAFYVLVPLAGLAALLLGMSLVRLVW